MISRNMIFRNTLFGVAVCLAGVLTACAEKEMSVAEPVVEEEQVEICFAPTVGADITTKGSDIQPIGETGLYLRTVISENKTNPFDEVATRATLVNGFDPDGAEGTYSTFRVYSFLHDGAWEDDSVSGDVTPYVNGKDVVSLGNGTWGFEESVFWPSWETNMTFIAFAPVDGGVDISFTEDEGNGNYVYASPTLVYSDPAVADDDTHHGTISDENLAKQYDLLVAQTPDLTKETNTIPMSFSHVFASVQFLCGNMTGGTISKLSLVNIAHEGVYDFGTNTWEVDSDNRTEYVFPLEVTVPETEDDVDLDAGDKMDSYDTNILGGSSALMMVPQDLTGSVLLLEYTPTDDDEPMELAVELSGEWEAGAHITYHISFLAGNDDVLPYLEGTDGIFAAYVLAHFDTDGDGHVSQEEADAVTELKIGYYPDDTDAQTPTSRIDFTGIEYFPNLQRFTSNYASALDLSQNLELNYIKLNSENSHTPNVSSLDLSKNTKLIEIADSAFFSNTSLSEVILPESITKIGDYAFYGVKKDQTPRFTELKLPEAVTSIGEHAFDGCTRLETVNLGNVTSIGEYAFNGCSALTGADLSSVEEINEGTFYSCSAMTSVTLSEDLTKVGASAFRSCSKLAIALAIPKGVTGIGDHAFYSCSALTSLTLSEGLTSIGDYAFQSCTALTLVTLPSTLVTIGDYAFGGSVATTAVTATFTVPEEGFTALTSIGTYAFSYCTGLTTFPLGDEVTEIGSRAFQYCSNLTDISGISGKLETLGEYAFYYCTALATDIVIPETITAIEQNVFRETAIPSVDLPSTIASLGNYAFYDCTSMETFICRSENPPTTGNSYTLQTNANPLPILYVYADYEANYKSKQYWDPTLGNARFSARYTLDDSGKAEGPDYTDTPGNYGAYMRNEGVTIGDRTYSLENDGTAIFIDDPASFSFPSGSSTGRIDAIYFVDATDEDGDEVTLSFKGGNNIERLVLIGNDPEKKTKVVVTRDFEVSPSYTSSDDVKVEIVLYNLDLDFSGLEGAMLGFNSDGAIDYFAVVDCHILANTSSNVITSGSSSYPGAYFNTVLISNSVWNLSASPNTKYIFHFPDADTQTISSLVMTNNLFYSRKSSDSSFSDVDFRIIVGNGMTISKFDYESNTMVNLIATTAGAVEYASLGDVTAEKNLTYVESPTVDYVFFHTATGDGSGMPTGTVTITDNIAYHGGTNYNWYWFYSEELGSTASSFTDCTVLSESPFDALDVTTETFTVKTEYSGYGYQAPDTGTTEP